MDIRIKLWLSSYHHFYRYLLNETSLSMKRMDILKVVMVMGVGSWVALAVAVAIAIGVFGKSKKK